MENFKCTYTTLLDISDERLKPNPKNNNRHTVLQIERLAKIIQFQGQRSSIVISNQSGFIVAGHARLEAMKELGWKQVAVDFQDFENEDQEYAHMTADNEIARWAELDFSLLNSEVPGLGPDFDIELLGLKNFEIEPLDKLNPLVDPDEIPEAKETRCKPGDIWQLGEHRLFCGDATLITDVQVLMQSEVADMVWTDPPYNVAYEGKTKEALTIKNDKMSAEDFRNFLTTSLSNMLISTKPGGAIYVAHADMEGENFRAAMRESGWSTRQCLVWV